MSAIGIILFVVGAFGVIGFLMQRHKAGRLGSTPVVSTGDAASKGASVAGPKGAIAVQGQVVCDQFLTSPVTGTACLYYDVTVTASWKVGDNKRTVPVSDAKVAARVGINDGSGLVEVSISSPSDDDCKESFKKSQKRGLGAALRGSNELAFGDHGFTLWAGQDTAKDKIPDDAEYTVVERVIRPMTTAYVSGKAEAGRIIAPSWVSLIFSSKSKEELLAGTSKMMKRTKYVAIGGLAAGAVFSLIGALTGGPSQAPASNATSAAQIAAPH